MRAIEAGLAAWFLAWLASLWYRTDWLRERFGVRFVLNDAGEILDREDAGGVGEWLNCPLCAAVVASLAAPLLPGKVREVLAGAGLAVALARWYEAARPKPRWWE